MNVLMQKAQHLYISFCDRENQYQMERLRAKLCSVHKVHVYIDLFKIILCKINWTILTSYVVEELNPRTRAPPGGNLPASLALLTSSYMEARGTRRWLVRAARLFERHIASSPRSLQWVHGDWTTHILKQWIPIFSINNEVGTRMYYITHPLSSWHNQ